MPGLLLIYEGILTPTQERLAPVPEAPKNPDAIGTMKHRLKTQEGKAFYAERKSTVEPVFGIIKEVMGFRRFLVRELEAVKGEWRLVCLAFNLKRLCALHQGGLLRPEDLKWTGNGSNSADLGRKKPSCPLQRVTF